MYDPILRDSTVQTLTLQPSVQDGVVVYQESPLVRLTNLLGCTSASNFPCMHVTHALKVRALKSNMVLVIDEADKAPTHVTCILKNLVEGGEFTLADGRRVVPGKLCLDVRTVYVFKDTHPGGIYTVSIRVLYYQRKKFCLNPTGIERTFTCI